MKAKAASPFFFLILSLIAGAGCASLKEAARDFAQKMSPTPHIQPPAEKQAMKPGIRRVLEAVQGKIQFPSGVVSVYGMNRRSSAEMQERLDAAHLAVEKALLLMPDANKIIIVGHSDPIGGPGQALRYGHARARSVRAYLITRGLPAGRLLTTSAGSSELLNKENMEAAENRRITFSVEAPEPPGAPENPAGEEAPTATETAQSRMR